MPPDDSVITRRDCTDPSASNILLSMCPLSIILTCQYHCSLFSVIFFLLMLLLLILSRMFVSDLILPCDSTHPSEHPHLIFLAFRCWPCLPHTAMLAMSAPHSSVGHVCPTQQCWPCLPHTAMLAMSAPHSSVGHVCLTQQCWPCLPHTAMLASVLARIWIFSKKGVIEIF